MTVQAEQIMTYMLNSKKNFWFLRPMQLFIHGQWWSILSTHRPHVLQ